MTRKDDSQYLSDNLVGNDDASNMAEVIAPATLPEGATFQAMTSGDNPTLFTVTVPKGGVKEGQQFFAPINLGLNADEEAQPLTGTLVDDSDTEMAEVVAPTTLPPGATFEATTSGPNPRIFTVTVPEGGVVAGQKFMAPINPTPKLRIPRGFWKDGLCDCCHYGCCHPVLWLSWIFPFVAIAQVMERMKLDYLGRPNPQPDHLTFKIVVGVWLGFMIMFSILTVLSGWGFQVFMQIYLLFIIIMTRMAVRKEFDIPEKNCKGCEDVCCGLFCGCCVIAQMARHTGEYESYDHQCISANGLPKGAPDCV